MELLLRVKVHPSEKYSDAPQTEREGEGGRRVVNVITFGARITDAKDNICAPLLMFEFS